MFESDLCAFSFWWIVPIVMMILCFFMMRGRRGTMMSRFDCCGSDWDQAKSEPSARDILDRRYASGDIDKAEHEEKKRTLTGPMDPDTVGNKPRGGLTR